jgi:hypothetical protein
MKASTVTIFLDGTRSASITGAPAWLIARLRKTLDAWAAADVVSAVRRTRTAKVLDVMAFLSHRFICHFGAN